MGTWTASLWITWQTCLHSNSSGMNKGTRVSIERAEPKTNCFVDIIMPLFLLPVAWEIQVFIMTFKGMGNVKARAPLPESRE